MAHDETGRQVLGTDAERLEEQLKTVRDTLAAFRSGQVLPTEQVERTLADATGLATCLDGLLSAAIRAHAEGGGSHGQLARSLGVARPTAQSRRRAVTGQDPRPAERWARGLYGTAADALVVSEALRSWSVAWPAYEALAVDITPPELRPGEGLDRAVGEWGAEPYATPEEIPGRERAERLAAALVPYTTDERGWPLHPHGRTGLRGRCLKCWGENRAADAIVLAGTGADLHILLVRRRDRAEQGLSEWALPGGHIDTGEAALDAALRELLEEAGADLTAAAALEEDPTLIYQGVVPDPRETDHAWMVTTAFLLLVAEQLPVAGDDDALEAHWFPASSREALDAAIAAAGGRLYAAHEPILTALFAHLAKRFTGPFVAVQWTTADGRGTTRFHTRDQAEEFANDIRQQGGTIRRITEGTH